MWDKCLNFNRGCLSTIHKQINTTQEDYKLINEIILKKRIIKYCLPDSEMNDPTRVAIHWKT